MLILICICLLNLLQILVYILKLEQLKKKTNYLFEKNKLDYRMKRIVIINSYMFFHRVRKLKPPINRRVVLRVNLVIFL